jgi:hypothetical protein
LPNGISSLIRDKNIFRASIVIVSFLKVVLSAVVPASYDLRDIVTLMTVPRPPIGPWIPLYPPLYQFANTSELMAWYLATPSAMSLNMQLTSLLFRLPILAMDIGIAAALYWVSKRIASVSEARLASLIWFMNPYPFLSMELLGVPDILALLFVVLVFSALIMRRPFVSGVFLGLGILVKLFPILLLPPILIYTRSDRVVRKNRLAILCLSMIGLLGYLTWVIPSGSQYLTQYTPVTQPMPVFVGSYITNSYGLVFVMILFYGLLNLFARGTRSALELLLPTFLIYYVVSNPYPQYLTWAIPLMAIDIALHPRRAPLFAGFCGLAFVQWFLASPGLITPSGYSLLMIPFTGNQLPWYSIAIGNLLDSPTIGNLIIPIASSSFYAVIIFYVVDLIRTWFGLDSRSTA